jgi:DNA adenine methylase
VSGRTPLTYYGGKQKLAAQIVALMPRHVAYLEPFAGGAAVLFTKPPAERETLNDIDGQIMRFWRALRDRPEDLAAAVELTPYSREEWGQSRKPADDDVEAARRLLVNVDQSFAQSRGSWRPGQLTGCGRWRPGVWENLPPRLLAAAQRLRGVSLENDDGLKLIPKWDRPETVIYVDPPYTGPERIARTIKYDHDDDGTLWAQLVEVLGAVENAAVILSGYPCKEVEDLDWRRIDLHANSNVRERRGTSETLWLSPAVPEPFPNLLTASEQLVPAQISGGGLSPDDRA